VFDFVCFFQQGSTFEVCVVMMMGIKDKTTELRALKFLLIFPFVCLFWFTLMVVGCLHTLYEG
jgi:hypothetical protein